jgi:Putative Ig domain
MMAICRKHAPFASQGDPMNSPRVVVSLALILILSLLWTACGGSKSTPPPPPGAPTIVTAVLPQGAVNAPYLIDGNSVTLSATGGTGTYTWGIVSGSSLPPGLILTSSTGIISGTPTMAGNFSFTVQVTDSANMSATANLSIYIEGAVSITAMSLPSGSPGVLYSQTLTATGGLPPYTWCVLAGSSGPCDPTQAALPPGLSLNASTGVISGTPTTDSPPPGFASFTVQVTDSETSPGIPTSGTATFTIAIMSVTTTSLPPGYLNTPYNGTLTVAGGSTPYSWTYSILPPGLTLASTCTDTKQQTCAITGTPTQTGTKTATVKVTDGEKSPAVAMASLPLIVYQGSQLTITTTTLPAGIEGAPYNATLTATGGVQPYNWSIISGTLPPGLSLDPKTCSNSSVPCVISGTPTTTGPFKFTVQVTDSGSPPQPATAQLSILISFSPLVITTSSLPAGLEGVPYSATLMAAGGVKPYTWCIFESNGTCDNGAGILPPGLTFNQSTGVISGTPTSSDTSSFFVQVQDSGSPQQTVKSTSPLSIVVTSLGNGSLSGNYVFNFSGYNGGTPVFMAGAFVADGKGNLTSGELDYNDGSGEGVPPVQQTFTTGSVYKITANGLGTMTVVTNTTTYQFAIAIRGDGSGSLIQSDPANPQAYGSGAIKVQTVNTICPIFQGVNVAIGLFGFDSTLQRYAGAGQFNFNDSTCADIKGVMDIDDNGNPASLTFTGAFNGGDGFGRSYLQIQNWNPTDPCGTKNGMKNTCTYASYAVSANEVVIIATDAISQPATLTLWSLLRQIAAPPSGFDNTILGGTSVADINALGNGAIDVIAGLFVGQGVSGHTCTSGQNGTPQYDSATFSYDENQGGVCNGGTCGQPQPTQGTYCVDKTTARVTLTPFNNGPFATPPVFYMVGEDLGFAVGTDLAVTSGALDPQTGSPFTDASLFGLYAGGTIAPVTSMVTNSVGALFADGGGNINGNEDTSGPGGPQQPPPFTYTYAVDNTGRALVCASGACNAQSGNIIGVAYVVSPTKFVLLPATDPNPALSVFSSGSGN